MTQGSDGSDGRLSDAIAIPQEWMAIGDMARTYGISLRTLRFYENRGLLRPRRNGATRLYGPTHRHRLELILKGKLLGFTLTEIRDMVARESPNGDASLALTADQIALQLDHLERQRRALDQAVRELQEVARRLRSTADPAAEIDEAEQRRSRSP